MAGSSLFILIDDIATLLDDIASMTKVATKKTAAVLGDDLAVNAQQVAGVSADRELPVVWAVAKGSFKNKLILVPAALAISAFIPWLIIPLLICGGIFLCFEGFEAIWHFLAHRKDHQQEGHERVNAISDESVDMLAFEKDKINGAIRTDLILSAEIIVISLGVVSAQPFITQVGVLSTIAIMITVGVYGLVAGIVKLDDAGLHLSKKENTLIKQLGFVIVKAAPMLMKFLSVFGTIAMFMVGGGIITHSIGWFHHLSDHISHAVETIPSIGAVLGVISPILFDMVIGMIIGAVAVLLYSLYKSISSKS
jgi:predicted DNA repair protein MutK